MTVEQWILYALTTIGTISGALWAFIKLIAPRVIDARIESERDAREHHQDMEDASLSALAQHNVLVTSQLVTINEKLVNDLVSMVLSRMDDLERKMALLHQAELRDEAQLTIIKMEWTRINDSLKDIVSLSNRQLGILEGKRNEEVN